MRIGVNCFMLQEHIGGMRQYFHRLFRELLENDRENYYVFFYFAHNIKEFEHLHNDRWKEHAILLNSQDEVNNYLNKIDLYFCPFGALWPRPIKVPSVVTLPDIQEKYFPEYFTNNDLFNRAYYYDASTRIADQVITISNFTKESIKKYHGISDRKIHVAYLCADASFYVDNVDEDQYNSTQLLSKYIYYPANRWLHKNHDNLLKALVILQKQYGLSINCVFTGHDVQNGYPLASKVKEYGLYDQVKIVGYLSNPELIKIYKRAEMLCFPSLFEGFGIPVLEAMALGCPVICSKTTSLPEVGGEAALYFDPVCPDDIADKINSLWKNKALRESFIQKGKRQALLFSASAMAEKHLDVFRKAASSFKRVRYYYQKMVYNPLYSIKMKCKKN